MKTSKKSLDPPGAGRLAAAEEGRRRIARELHDDFGQRLAGLALALKAVRKQLPDDDLRRLELDTLGGHLAELAEDLRRLSHDLHPAILERRGLAEALRDHCVEIERRHGLPVRLHLDGAADSFPPEIALGFYRITQEALTNAVRHAGARVVHVTLRAAPGEAHLTVADDGCGFEPHAARRAGGVGLASMEERAQLLGGRCRITSVPGAGAEIEVAVSLPGQGALAQLAELSRRHRGLVASVAAESERLLQRALAIRKAALPEDALALAGGREALALLRLKQGRPAEAAALLERLAATAEQVYGPEHPQLARTLLNLGLARSDLGEDEAARQLFERALAIIEQALTPDHPLHVQALADLANFHFTRGRYAEAEPLYRRLLALRDQGAAYDAWDQLLANWAQLLRATGRPAEAANVAGRAAPR